MITVTMSISCSLTDSLKGLMKLQYFGPLMLRDKSLEKTLMLGKSEGKRRRVAEDEMLEQHHRLRRHELEQTPGRNEGQGSLSCYSQWGCKESDMTWQLNNNYNNILLPQEFLIFLKNLVQCGAQRKSSTNIF